MRLIIVMLFFIVPSAFAAVSAKSCSGTVRYCDEFGICTDDYYYLYSYQVTKIVNGSLKKVRSRLKLRGAIGVAGDYNLTLELHDNRVVYLGIDFDLAIPVSRINSILYRNKTGEWTELCP